MRGMSDLKDSTIKLFGKTIQLPNQQEDVASTIDSCSGEAGATRYDCFDENPADLCVNKSEADPEVEETNREPSLKETTDDKQQNSCSDEICEDSKEPTTSSGNDENPKTHSAEGETSSAKSAKNGEQSETSVSQEKTLKKPDKILPCPRCNSMDTKFCYYNNYNVNQPRHFCKNCQRYWTAGGTMRNVPVGAGRRKNKSSSASHYRNIMVAETLRTAQAHAMNGVHSPSLVTNGTVLTFGSDSPLCESVASVLNLSEKSQNGLQNGYHRPEQRILLSHGGATDNGEDCSSGSSITANSNASDKCSNNGPDVVMKSYQGFHPQMPCFPGHPWPYTWNSAMPPPAFSSGFPVSFYPGGPTYWGCTVPGPWNYPPCVSPPSPSLNQCAPVSSPTSPLGKHSRDGDILNQGKPEESSERTVFAPRTLRFDDPSEAARSSVRTALGIENDKSNSTNGARLFKGFQSNNVDKGEKSPLLQANPAALSRSLSFRESNC